MKLKSFLKLIAFIGVCELAGIIGSVFTSSSVKTWYAGLAKPILNPPNWIFAPVWTILFALMGIAVFLVFEKGGDRKEVKESLGIFAVQLSLNIFWSFLFFGLQSPGTAFIEIIFLWFAIAVTIISFAKISKQAAWLMTPYILWVSFAGYLNFAVWLIN
jgi:tryptophan-rich sensory protein